MSTSESIQRGPPKIPDKHWLENRCGNERCREVIQQIFANTKNPAKIEIDYYNPARSLDRFCREKHENPQECRKLVREFSKCFFTKYDFERADPY